MIYALKFKIGVWNTSWKVRALVVFASEISLVRFYFYVNNSCVNAVVNFLSQVIFVFLLFFGMVMYANEVKTRTLSQRW